MYGIKGLRYSSIESCRRRVGRCLNPMPIYIEVGVGNFTLDDGICV